MEAAPPHLNNVDYDQYVDSYDEEHGGEPRGAQAARLVEQHLVDGLTLEIGVGTALVAMHMRREVIGVDLSAAMLGRAAARVGGLVRADAARLPFADGTFANAYSVWCLHTLLDVAAAIAEASRVLRPGGRLVVYGTRLPGGGPVEDILSDLYARARGGPPPDHPELMIPAATQTGLRVIVRAEDERRGETLASQAIASLRQGHHSALDRLSEGARQTLIAETVGRLNELPDRPHPWRTAYPITVFQKD